MFLYIDPLTEMKHGICYLVNKLYIICLNINPLTEMKHGTHLNRAFKKSVCKLILHC